MQRDGWTKQRERWANLFWLAAFVFFVLFVGGRASALINGFLPQAHHEVETPIEPYAGLTPVQIGERVFLKQGCQGCHQIGLIGGIVGPSLSNAGVRRPEDWLRQQWEDPQAHVPGNYMPAYAFLTAQEKDGLVAYVKSLDGSRAGPETGAEPVPANLFRPHRPPAHEPALIERGQTLFLNNGCGSCHTVAGLDGARGVIGPNLTREGWRGRSDAWQKQHLIQPLSVYADETGRDAAWPMPGFQNLSDGDLDALVAYLQSLR